MADEKHVHNDMTHQDDPDHCVECCKQDTQELLDVLCALLVLPDGYCCCTVDQQRAGHTGECREAREVIKKHGLEVGTYPRS